MHHFYPQSKKVLSHFYFLAISCFYCHKVIKQTSYKKKSTSKERYTIQVPLRKSIELNSYPILHAYTSVINGPYPFSTRRINRYWPVSGPFVAHFLNSELSETLFWLVLLFFTFVDFSCNPPKGQRRDGWMVLLSILCSAPSCTVTVHSHGQVQSSTWMQRERDSEKGFLVIILFELRGLGRPFSCCVKLRRVDLPSAEQSVLTRVRI